MKVRAKKIELVPLSKIKLNPKNRNKHTPEQIDQLVKLIKYQGYRAPGTISNQSGYLAAGEGRYLALKKMGVKEMPVMYQDFDSEEQEYAYGVSDNAIALQAALDLSAINIDLPDLGPDFDIDWLGLKDFSIEPMDKEFNEKEVDENIETKKECPSCGYKW